MCTPALSGHRNIGFCSPSTLKPAVLISRCRSALAPPPNPAQAVFKQLQPLHAALSASATAATAGAAPGPAAHAFATGTRPPSHLHPLPHVHLDLDGVQGLPLQPTLQGLLLGYPLVYHVPSSDAAATACRCLSALGLVLHRMEAQVAPHVAAAVGQAQVASRGGKAGQVQGPERDLLTLCAFSVPRGLEEEEEVAVAVRTWSGRVVGDARGGMGETRTGGDGRLWAACTLRSEVHATPSVAL